MIRRIVLASIIAALGACSSPRDDISGAYVGGDETALLQLHIVEGEDGTITGNIAVSQLNYQEGKVELTTKAINGVRRGDQLSLVAKANALGAPDAPLQLEAASGSLTLMVPATGQSLVLEAMDQEQYRKELADFAELLNANDVGLLP